MVVTDHDGDRLGPSRHLHSFDGGNRCTDLAYKWPVRVDELDQIRRSRELDALRIVAVARLGVAAVMIAALFIGSPLKWPQFSWVPWFYGAVAVGAAVLLFTPLNQRLPISRFQLLLLIIDVVSIFTYKVSAADGTYVPLLVLTLLPIMVVLDVSWHRAAAALFVIATTFAIEIFTDPVVFAQAGRGRAVMATVVFVFLCGTVFLAVLAQARKLDEISALSASRQELLVDLMTASEDQQRRISEYLHDGPLQSVLMARQDIVSVLKEQPSAALERALAGLKEATAQMREATFELHPAVLGGAGLARAITQLVTANSDRSGIDIIADIDYPGGDARDSMLFAVTRELVSNVVRHSCATRARVSLRADDGTFRLDVVDDGVGLSGQDLLQRLQQGHIGIASQRARIEAAGGEMRVLPVPTGSHISVTLPMTPPAT
jgi:two-component system NarL family sensor kinase